MAGRSTGFNPVSLSLLILLLCGIPMPVRGDYPRIRRLNREDVLYLQLERDINLFHRAAAGNAEFPAFQLFTFTVEEEMSIFALAARFNLPYETIATVNRLGTSEPIPKGSTLLIPNMPGLSVPKHPKNELEKLMASVQRETAHLAFPLTVRTGDRRSEFRFYPGERFTQHEFSQFLGILFTIPLKDRYIKLSSYYGPRMSPFSGSLHEHHGIDIAAPRGTPVTASRRGRVAAVGEDEVFGKYVLLFHESDYATFYGHLDSCTVELNQTVDSGYSIGTLGNTGLSTGPHLHFEIRKKGIPVDPLPLLPKDLK
jgi:murein DD-endopeptidase MepM/ murein hydrolase activator NlpD